MSAPDVPLKEVIAGTLLQHASRVIYRGLALYFGSDGTNRYDDPAKKFGVLYLGFELPTVLMESVFHEHSWRKVKKRTITRSEVSKRTIRAVEVTSDLHLADLTARGVMAGQFGLNLSQLSARNYRHTQNIASTIHSILERSGQPRYDGLLYPSRNNYPASCIALFARAASKIQLIDDIDLNRHMDWPDFVTKYKIAVLPA